MSKDMQVALNICVANIKKSYFIHKLVSVRNTKFNRGLYGYNKKLKQS